MKALQLLGDGSGPVAQLGGEETFETFQGGSVQVAPLERASKAGFELLRQCEILAKFPVGPLAPERLGVLVCEFQHVASGTFQRRPNGFGVVRMFEGQALGFDQQVFEAGVDGPGQRMASADLLLAVVPGLGRNAHVRGNAPEAAAVRDAQVDRGGAVGAHLVGAQLEAEAHGKGRSWPRFHLVTTKVKLFGSDLADWRCNKSSKSAILGRI